MSSSSSPETVALVNAVKCALNERGVSAEDLRDNATAYVFTLAFGRLGTGVSSSNIVSLVQKYIQSEDCHKVYTTGQIRFASGVCDQNGTAVKAAYSAFKDAKKN